MSYIDIVFDKLPGHDSAKLIETEDETGASISVGEWVSRSDGYVALRIPRPTWTPPMVYTLLDTIAQLTDVKVRRLDTNPDVYELSGKKDSQVMRYAITVEATMVQT